MQRKNMGNHLITSIAGENVRAFVPSPLPPKPALIWSPELVQRQEAAAIALGRLDSMTSFLPEPSLFLYSYVRKEAVLSSQIEGTQSSLSDLLAFENAESPGLPENSDVVEVSNYVSAMEHGLKRLRGDFPLCLRLIREIHEILLSQGRGHAKQPGAFRSSQNWIGGTRPGNAVFVPPPPHLLSDCLGSFEKFLHDERTPVLEKAALAHVQFETIHPFLDGNGRVGRLLITLLMCWQGALHQPLLYLSLYFKKHRSVYYDLLQKVRIEGDWEAWLTFFFEGVRETAEEAVQTAKNLLSLYEKDRQRLLSQGRVAGSILQVHHYFQVSPLCSPKRVVETLKLSPATVNKALDYLQKLKILRETTGKQRDRLFSYQRYLQILNKGME
ncbi:MAG TPA: cell filamentation protein Fic [Deltaproteobacteria bacterium]|nr:cell filamentation protein Fic [Deltaproteobacteria bacterium]